MRIHKLALIVSATMFCAALAVLYKGMSRIESQTTADRLSFSFVMLIVAMLVIAAQPLYDRLVQANGRPLFASKPTHKHIKAPPTVAASAGAPADSETELFPMDTAKRPPGTSPNEGHGT